MIEFMLIVPTCDQKSAKLQQKTMPY